MNRLRCFNYNSIRNANFHFMTYANMNPIEPQFSNFNEASEDIVLGFNVKSLRITMLDLVSRFSTKKMSKMYKIDGFGFRSLRKIGKLTFNDKSNDEFDNHYRRLRNELES